MRHRAALRRRRRLFDRARGWTRLVSVEAHDLTFVVPTWDEAVGRRLFVRRTRGEMSLLPRVLTLLDERGLRYRGRVFVDVGANIGTTSLVALRCGFSSVLALEPVAENARLLRANAALNGLEGRLEVVEAAASDDAGVVRLELSRRNSGGHRIAQAAGTVGATARSLRLDGLLAGVDVGLLWLDVQGHEEAALSGAGGLLARLPVVAEVSPGSWLGDFAALFGVAVEALDLRSGEPIASVREIASRQAEVLFLPAQARANTPYQMPGSGSP